MIYLIDIPKEDSQTLSNSLKLLEKRDVSSDALSEIKTNIASSSEPIIVMFGSVTENLITLLKNNSRIDLFLAWGSGKDFEEFSLKSDHRYLGAWLPENANHYHQIFGIYRFLKNQKLKESFFSNKIESLSSELKSVVGLLEKEVYFSRDRYKQVRKKLEKSIGNLKFSSIYKVGLNSGSEINEIFEKNGKTYWTSFSTSTYSASADFIRELEQFLGNDENFDQFTERVIDIVEKNHFDSSNLKTFLLEIDQGRLRAKGFLWGDYYLLSNEKKNIHFPKMIPLEKEFIDQARVSLQLEREEKLLLISPGVLKNFDHVRDQDSLVKFCLSHIEKGQEDLLDELMIELKMKYNDDFFENDSFLTYMEVSPNAILAVD